MEFGVLDLILNLLISSN